jgi:hypothetical protein
MKPTKTPSRTLRHVPKLIAHGTDPRTGDDFQHL